MRPMTYTPFMHPDDLRGPPGGVLRVQKPSIRGAVVLDRRPPGWKRGTTHVPLTLEGIESVRVAVEPHRSKMRRPLCVVTALAGAKPEESARVRAKDIDLESGTVTFGGWESSTRPVEARTNPLDDWSIGVIRRFMSECSPVKADDLLCVRPTTPPHKAAGSVRHTLSQALRQAGLSRHPGITASSLRLGAGLQVLNSDGIEAATRFLGYQSLDTTAQVLCYDWRHDDA